MQKRIGIILMTILIIIFISATVLGEGYLKKIEVFFDNIKVEVNGKEANFDTEPFTYNSRLYVPIRFVIENMGGEVTWDEATRKATMTSYTDFPDCDYLKGEIFVYGMITDIDFEKRSIEIEQHFDDNSIEVTPLLELKEDAVIILEMRSKRMNLELKDLKIGDSLGLILDSNGKVRGIILSI